MKESYSAAQILTPGATMSGFINRSAGCIGLFKADAKWLNHEFVKRGTIVVVKN